MGELKAKANKKTKREEKKKIKSRRKRNKIIAMIIISIIVFTGYFFLINTSPSFIIYSNENTESYSGVVTDVYTIKKYTGYKNRKVTWIYLEFDNEQTFRINYKMLRRKDLNYESFKETVHDNKVEITSSQSKPEKLVSIKCKDNSIITFGDTNKTSHINRVALALVCIVVIIFIFVPLSLKT